MIVGCARVSSGKQVEDGNGLDAQIQTLKAHGALEPSDFPPMRSAMDEHKEQTSLQAVDTQSFFLMERDTTMLYEEAVDLWQAKNIKNDADLAEALNNQDIAFAFHSGKIENDDISYHDTQTVFRQDGVSCYTGNVRALFEIRNAKRAFDLFLDAFGEKRPLDESLIKEFQTLLTEGTYDERRWKRGERPGQYKIGDYIVGKYEAGADPEDVPEKMAALIEEIRETKNPTRSDILTIASYLHAELEDIHPFADGNGRTGRLVMNYFLVSHDHPLIVIHEDDREEYYEVLHAWHLDRELQPLRVFLREQTERTWKRKIERTRKAQPSKHQLQDYLDR